MILKRLGELLGLTASKTVSKTATLNKKEANMSTSTPPAKLNTSTPATRHNREFRSTRRQKGWCYLQNADPLLVNILALYEHGNCQKLDVMQCDVEELYAFLGELLNKQQPPATRVYTDGERKFLAACVDACLKLFGEHALPGAFPATIAKGLLVELLATAAK